VLLDCLVQVALELCDAGSAGISLLISTPEGEQFRWEALSGAYANYVGGRTPRDFSPCGTCLDLGAPQLYDRPARYFEYLGAAQPPIVEGLVVPFYRGEEPLGTIWVVTHDDRRSFDREDVRVMQSLAGFVGIALGTIQSVSTAESALTELQIQAEELAATNAQLGQLIDERGRAERALQESEERLRLSVEAANIGAWDFDPRTKHLSWSDRCRLMFGLPLEARVDYDRFLACIHPEDRQRAQAAMSYALDPEGRGSIDVEFRVLWPDGTVRWIVSKGQAFFSGPGPSRRATRLVGTLLDITERKQAEGERNALLQRERDRSRQLRKLADAAQQVNAAPTLSAMLEIITHSARDIIGAHQAVTSMTVNHEWAQAINSVSLSERYAAWADYDVAPDGSGIYAEVCRANRPMRMTQAELEAHPAWRGFGSQAEYHPPLWGWLAVPLVARDGRNLGLIQISHKYYGEFTAEDEAILSQLGQMAAVAIEKEQLYEEIRRSSRTKDEFLAMLAHELRNPLAPLRNAVRVLQAQRPPDTRTERLYSVIDRQSEHMARLLEDLLDVSRITQGKIELRREVVDLAAIVQQTVDAGQDLVAARGQSLTVSLPAEPLWLDADPTRLHQVIGNLLSNAAKYTQPGGRIEVRLEADAGCAVVRVTDNGGGIDPAFVPHLFELFAQEDRSVARLEGGLGIGLTMVQRLVHLHGGSVEAHSDGLGLGSEFVVRLPLTPRRLETAPVPENAPARQNEVKRRVLVVDDNQDAAETLCDLLALWGHETLEANDGRSALEAVRRYSPELILLDLSMPGMDGYEVARSLQDEKLLGDATLVALTGYGQVEDRRRTREAGFHHHLTKPVDPEALRNLLAGAGPR
jgi:PAS domain S-box-containing protein